MRRMDKQQTMILLIGAVLLTAFAVLRYVPIVRTKLASRDMMDRHDTSMQQVGDYAKVVPELRQEKRQLVDQLDSFSVKIPEGKQFAKLWQQIADVMNECQLSEQLVQPGTVKESQQLNCVPLTIECSGSFEQMFQFVQSLEKLDRLVRLEEIDLQNSNDFDATMKLNAKANIYYQSKTPDNG
ncbi:MAG: type 4a pilus biogenesis protein PilO [Planctomycetota bacterium]